MAWAGAEVLQFVPSGAAVGAPARDRYVVLRDRNSGVFAVFDVQTETSRQFSGLGVDGLQMCTSADGNYVWDASRDPSGNVRLSKIDPATGGIVYWTGPATAGVGVGRGCVDTGDLVWVWYNTSGSTSFALAAFDKTMEIFIVVDTVTANRPYLWYHAGIVYWAGTNRRYNATTTAALTPTANVVPSNLSQGQHTQPRADGIAWWPSTVAPYANQLVGWDLPGNTAVVTKPITPGDHVARLDDYVFVVNGGTLSVYNTATDIVSAQALPTARVRYSVFTVGGKLVIPSVDPASW